MSLPSAIRLILCLLIGSAAAGCYVESPSVGPEVLSTRISELLVDGDPDLRRTAAEALGKLGRRSARSGLVSALNDPDARVRFQCALSLGELNDERIITALARIAVRDADDRWARAAVLSSVRHRVTEFLHALIQNDSIDWGAHAARVQSSPSPGTTSND